MRFPSTRCFLGRVMNFRPSRMSVLAGQVVRVFFVAFGRGVIVCTIIPCVFVLTMFFDRYCNVRCISCSNIVDHRSGFRPFIFVFCYIREAKDNDGVFRNNLCALFQVLFFAKEGSRDAHHPKRRLRWSFHTYP